MARRTARSTAGRRDALVARCGGSIHGRGWHVERLRGAGKVISTLAFEQAGLDALGSLSGSRADGKSTVMVEAVAATGAAAHSASRRSPASSSRRLGFFLEKSLGS